MPHRVQLSRKKGWRMPPNTVKVDRSTKWGNPFLVEEFGREIAVEQFREWLEVSPQGQTLKALAQTEIRGKNLACWCPMNGPCHADVWLDVVNR